MTSERTWQIEVRRLGRGRYVMRSRARDADGNMERQASVSDRTRVEFQPGPRGRSYASFFTDPDNNAIVLTGEWKGIDSHRYEQIALRLSLYRASATGQPVGSALARGARRGSCYNASRCYIEQSVTSTPEMLGELVSKAEIFVKPFSRGAHLELIDTRLSDAWDVTPVDDDL